MIKIKHILLLFLIFTLSGCFLVDNDELMVCENQAIENELDFEVSYHGNEILEITRITSFDFSNLEKTRLTQKVKEWENQMKQYKGIEGINAQLNVEVNIITERIHINLDKYDVLVDPLQLFEFEFEEKDLQSVKNMKLKLESKGYVCDDIIKN